MSKNTTLTDLENTIQKLENKKTEEWLILKEEVYNTYNSLKPVSLIKSTLHGLAVDPDFKGDVLNASMSLAAGFVSKRIAIGSTTNPFKQLLGTLLQMGVTRIVAKNADEIKTSTRQIFGNVFNASDKNST